jgi:hypothetical protein
MGLTTQRQVRIKRSLVHGRPIGTWPEGTSVPAYRRHRPSTHRRTSTMTIEIGIHTLALECGAPPLHRLIAAWTSSRASEMDEDASRPADSGRPDPLCPLVPLPSCQGTAPDVSSASAEPTLTALVIRRRSEDATPLTRCVDFRVDIRVDVHSAATQVCSGWFAAGSSSATFVKVIL